MKKTALMGEIRGASNDELKTRVRTTEEQLFQHRLKRYTNQLENTNLIRAAKREIARAKTVMSQRAAGLEGTAEKGKE